MSSLPNMALLDYLIIQSHAIHVAEKASRVTQNKCLYYEPTKNDVLVDEPINPQNFDNSGISERLDINNAKVCRKRRVSEIRTQTTEELARIQSEQVIEHSDTKRLILKPHRKNVEAANVRQATGTINYPRQDFPATGCMGQGDEVATRADCIVSATSSTTPPTPAMELTEPALSSARGLDLQSGMTGNRTEDPSGSQVQKLPVNEAEKAAHKLLATEFIYEQVYDTSTPINESMFEMPPWVAQVMETVPLDAQLLDKTVISQQSGLITQDDGRKAKQYQPQTGPRRGLSSREFLDYSSQMDVDEVCEYTDKMTICGRDRNPDIQNYLWGISDD